MSKPVKLVDRDARERIVSDLGTNLLVEAGAGSGKTHEMAARMAAGVASGHYTIEQMAAVTFTRKAAAELRGRFQLALEDELAKTVNRDQARHDRLRDALSNLERLFAGTIHSFCAHLLRARPVEAGVSPGFTELDEDEDELLRKQAWRDFLGHARATGNESLIELREAGIKPSDLDQAFEIVSNDEDVGFPPGEGKSPAADKIWKALDLLWAEISRLLPHDMAADSTCPTQKASRRFSRQLRIAETRRDRPAVLAQLLELWDFPPAIVQKWWASDAATKKRMKEAVVGLHERFRTDIVEPFLAGWRDTSTV